MRYRVLLSIEIDARFDQEAVDHAITLRELLKSPMVEMAVRSKGVQLSGDGSPIVYEPQRSD